MGRWFAKVPCAHCPYRRDVKPFLHPDRAVELAYLTENKYNEFHCHKTVDYDECDDGEGSITEESLVCAGFLSMQCDHGGKRIPDGFNFSALVYAEPMDMIGAYEDAWNERGLS